MYKLREIEKKDIEIINKWRKNEELIQNLGATYRYINLDVENKWYDNYLVNRNTTVRCAITMEDDDIIGLITLANIDNVNRTAVLHIMIGEEENCGKGVGSFAISKMLSHAFLDLNLNRVELEVLTQNIRAKKTYEKLGFKYEGTKREAYFKNGNYNDVEIMAILKKDFYSTTK